MVQVPRVRVPAQAEGWAEVWDKAEAGWADLLPQDRAETAYAQAAAQPFLMLPVSLATKEIVPNAGRK